MDPRVGECDSLIVQKPDPEGQQRSEQGLDNRSVNHLPRMCRKDRKKKSGCPKVAVVNSKKYSESVQI